MARRDAIAVKERSRALALLRRIEAESLFASPVLAGETGFVRTLVLGVLRWRSRLDFVIETLAKRAIEPEILDVLRLGVYQLLFMDVARYAAVSETVELAPKRARGFVNAILRRLDRGEVPEPSDLATRTAHPPWLIERWTRTYGAERAARIAEANQEMSYPDVLALGDEVPPGAGGQPAAGGGASSASRQPPAAGPEAVPSALVDHIYKLGGSSADLDRNKFWPMDEGSAVIAAIAANAGSKVLDLAAAPGSKTLYMRRAGARVVSNDISISRLLVGLKPGLQKTGFSSSLVVSDARTPAFTSSFDVVLLDAPCSATGTIRKNPELKWRLREADLATFATLQRDMIASALSLTKKYVIYSTCSLEREENDDLVASSGAQVVDITPFTPSGARAWIENGVLRLTPESGADGFTAHVLVRHPEPSSVIRVSDP
jgi:16S rRNA (cytosine967-C5)-methyltransferase